MGQHCQIGVLQLPFKEISALKQRPGRLDSVSANSNVSENPVLPAEICLSGCFGLTAFSHHQVVSTLIFYGQEYFWDHNQDAALRRWVDIPSALSVCRVVPRIVGWFNISSVISQFPSTLPVWKRNTVCRTRQREVTLQLSCSHRQPQVGQTHAFSFLHLLQVQFSLPASHISVEVCSHVSVCL